MNLNSNGIDLPPVDLIAYGEKHLQMNVNKNISRSSNKHYPKFKLLVILIILLKSEANFLKFTRKCISIMLVFDIRQISD